MDLFNRTVRNRPSELAPVDRVAILWSLSRDREYHASLEMEMVDFDEVARASELPLGRCKLIEVRGRKIVVYHIESGFFATDNACPHRGGPLAEGDLIGDEIVCPWHLWSFNVATGVNPGSPPGGEICVATHEVKVEGDAIFLRVTAADERSMS